MALIKKITKIGNSYGIIINNELLANMGLGPDSEVRITEGNGYLQIEPSQGRENRIMKAAAKYLDLYNRDFKKLAE